ncbi:MAG: DUF456 domain-containing protein [Planctomycetes bacterium]|nr:DUF456 domain-containing protein [Planctomycetota bacterium]
MPENHRKSRSDGFQLIEITAMNSNVLPFVEAVLLVLGSLFAWLLTVLQLPGNWLMVLLTAMAAWLIPEETRFSVGWPTVGIVFALAVVGEVLELATGAVAAKKQGASRRAVCLALVGGIAGALFGAGGGSVVPVLGTLIGILAGGAAGAFLGAYLGETWKGRSEAQAVAVGRAVAIGRTLGVLGKMSVGVVMVLIVAWDAFF